MLIAHSKDNSQNTTFTSVLSPNPTGNAAEQAVGCTCSGLRHGEEPQIMRLRSFDRAAGTSAHPSLLRDLVSTLEGEQTLPRHGGRGVALGLLP